MKIVQENIFFTLLIFLPISIIVGPAVSLVNILLIGATYLYFFFKYDHFKYLFKNDTIKIFIILYLYLVLNTLISLSFETSVLRNFGFIRFIILFLGINYLFYIDKKNTRIFYFWTIIFLVFIFDVNFERFTGANIFGWGAISLDGENLPHGPRVVSFFKDEPIAAAFINGFIFLILGQILNVLKNQKYRNVIFLVIILIFFFSVLITGERSNTLKAAFGLLLFIYLIDIFDLRLKLIFIIIFPIMAVITVLNSDYLKSRYYGQIFSKVFTEKKFKNLEDNIYIKLYKSGFSVFKNYPLIGVGNKNYRIETCDNIEKVKKNNYYCITHPHQIYFEFLSEHGLIGTLLLLSIFFSLIFRYLKVIILSQNYLQIGAFVFLITNFLPLIPSGSFFSDFNISLFILNLSILYAVNKKTNVFNKKYNL